jgi:dTDP-4-dehydrorhamnose 3,5-epimerase
MKVKELTLNGLFLVSEEPMKDERGEFSRVYCSKEFEKNGLESYFQQVNRSISKEKGTLRGLHFQVGKSAEAKYVRVLAGEIFDVAVDVRPESSTYLKWEAVKLNSSIKTGFYLSPGFAHGIMTLQENTEIEYFVSQPYDAVSERGLLWNDTKIGIQWPMDPTVISKKDSSWGAL